MRDWGESTIGEWNCNSNKISKQFSKVEIHVLWFSKISKNMKWKKGTFINFKKHRIIITIIITIINTITKNEIKLLGTNSIGYLKLLC